MVAVTLSKKDLHSGLCNVSLIINGSSCLRLDSALETAVLLHLIRHLRAAPVTSAQYWALLNLTCLIPSVTAIVRDSLTQAVS